MTQKRRVSKSWMQQCIRELIKQEGLDLDSNDSQEEEKDDEEEKQPARRGRRAIPEKWTRVISVKSDDLTNIRTFELASELLLDQSFGNQN